MAHDPSKFWHLDKIKYNGTYTDFEGMADPTPSIYKAKKFAAYGELNEMQTDLLLHFTYEQADQTDFLPTNEEMHAFCHAIQSLTECSEWMKTGVDWSEIGIGEI